MVNLTRYRVFGRVGLNLIFTACCAAIGIFVVLTGFLSWNLSLTNISLHALFGILAMMIAALAILRVHRDTCFSNIILYSAFLFIGVLHLIGAMLQLYNIALPGSNRPPYLLLLDLLEITLFVAMISMSVLTRLWWDRPVETRYSWMYGTGITGSSLGLFGTMYILSPLIPYNLILILVLNLICLSTGFIGLAVYFVFLSNEFRNQYDRLWMINGLLQYMLAIPFFLVSILFPVQIWIIAIMCILFGLISFNLAISIPELKRIGMQKVHAFAYAFIFSIFAFSPFFTGMVLELLTPVGVINYPLYVTIRLGAVVMSMGIAILLFIHFRQRMKRSLLPLMLAFVFWAIIEGVLIVGGPYDVILQGSEVPYIIGYFAIFSVLGLGVYWKERPPKQKMEKVPWGRIIGGIIALLLVLVISVYLEGYLYANNPVFYANPFDSTFMLNLSFVNIFLFTILGYLSLKETRGQITIEVLGLSFLMLWIIPGILKSIFPQWQMGWWAAEILLLGGLLVAPFIFGVAYIRNLQVTEDSEKRAKLYSDILAHDISNYHQAMLTSLELLELPDLPQEMEEEVKMEIHLSLRRADHLIKNVRQLGKIEHMPKIGNEPMDLVATINLAADQVFKALRAENIIYHISEPEGKCFIDANPLLIDLFQNLIRNAVEYSDGENRVDVEIDAHENNGRDYYRILIIDYGRGIPPERKEQLFSRYMDGAFGSGIGLSVVRALCEAFDGWVDVEDRVPGDFEKGTVFIVTLPKSSNSS